MIDMSAATELVMFWTPISFLVAFLLFSLIALFVGSDRDRMPHSSAIGFFRKMGVSLALALLVGVLACMVEYVIWETTANPSTVLPREIERVYGIKVENKEGLMPDEPGIGAYSDGRKVAIRYDSATSTLETVETWSVLPGE